MNVFLQFGLIVLDDSDIIRIGKARCNNLIENIVDRFHSLIQDYKTKLQEYIQSDSSRTLHYELVSEKGPANAPEFVMNVIVDGLVLGTGRGVSKKQAEQNAARNAFEKLAK